MKGLESWRYPGFSVDNSVRIDFLVKVTLHIPNKGDHQIRYYGIYSNKKRGMLEMRCPELTERKKPKAELTSDID
jgi:hypothetical protein